MPESRDERRENRTFDVPGAVTITAGLSLLVYALVNANDAGWGSTETIGLAAVALALIGAFLVIESRTKDPLVPFDIFASRTRNGSYIVGLLLAASACTRFGVFDAGIESAKNPRYTIEPQKRRLAARRAAGITDDSITTGPPAP